MGIKERNLQIKWLRVFVPHPRSLVQFFLNINIACINKQKRAKILISSSWNLQLNHNGSVLGHKKTDGHGLWFLEIEMQGSKLEWLLYKVQQLNSIQGQALRAHLSRKWDLPNRANCNLSEPKPIVIKSCPVGRFSGDVLLLAPCNIWELFQFSFSFFCHNFGDLLRQLCIKDKYYKPKKKKNQLWQSIKITGGSGKKSLFITNSPFQMIGRSGQRCPGSPTKAIAMNHSK